MKRNYDSDAIAVDDATSRQAIHTVSASGNNFIDGVLSGYAWSGKSLNYAFPDSASDYDYDGEPDNNFGTVGSKVQAAARTILDQADGNSANDGFSVEGFTKLKISEGSDTKSEIRYAESSSANPTAYAYYPSSSDIGGDVWMGTQYNFNKAEVGNYYYTTVLHETGHALGLKHGHVAESGFPALADKYDSLEYSVMTYASYSGASTTAGYVNETWGYPQTYMMADIAALQYMYGADFTTNSGNTVYSWKPTSGDTIVNGKVAIEPGANRIFATIWDGGGKHDTYDLSAYSSNVSVDLRPGEESVFSHKQLAQLDYADSSNNASGNIYNALLYKNNQDSLIEDAIGGSGNDKLYGNQGANTLTGGKGDDRCYGSKGNDLLVGGKGDDTFFFEDKWDKDTIKDFSGKDKIDLSDFKLDNYSDVKAMADNSHGNVVIDFGGGDVLTIAHMHVSQLGSGDFIL